MTTYKQALEQGKRWPLGPDDLNPSKVTNVYLYAGGRTRRLKILLAEIYAAWGLGTIALDRYLTKNRAFAKQNYFLERTCMYSVRFFFATSFVLWFGLPVSQYTYWKMLDVSVGSKPLTRDPRPNWAEGEGILDRQ